MRVDEILSWFETPEIKVLRAEIKSLEGELLITGQEGPHSDREWANYMSLLSKDLADKRARLVFLKKNHRFGR